MDSTSRFDASGHIYQLIDKLLPFTSISQTPKHLPTMEEEVDPAFIQEIEHRPKISTVLEDDGIPLIDLSDDDHRTTESIAAEIGNSCRDWGFFQVINHGVPPEKLRRVQEASKMFFTQPPEEKKKVRRDEASVLGYYETEHTKNVRDWKEVFDIVVQNPTIMPASHEPDDTDLTEWTNKWPEYPPELREACEEYGEEMEKLSRRLMELIALSLGLAPERFHGFFDNQHTSSIRLNHYPPCPAPHQVLGLGRHKDAGALTVLATDDVGGLEVKRKRDGEWVRVNTAPEAYIINVGDIIQVWSNDEYESVEHRVVVNSEKERFSMPFRLNPGHEVMVEPLEELVNEENPAKYRAYNWGKFQATKKRSNFMKLKVENLQISHFRLP